ncbi:Integrase, site-specific serine recombinase [Marinitoga phage MPV1]|uniref:Site-specific recombinase, DNA invertase Pin n=1 Tax=Marinitoga piezophila (strain DSM 14283 / JCM 11233 / KA3) TaxID=443254 RepID=H2J414_MARPK|nr:recombinase family protein [Marinitoga piezophila]AEX84742.1 site-specific recombinase, DNA invertase Pin [Marinitoga piezophila KA3]
MKKAAAYARVSTKDQSKISIEGQFKTIENFAKQYGFKIVDYFSDKDSGKKMKREQLDILLENAYKGKYDVILVEKYDRFSRAGIDGQVIIQDLEKNYNVLVIAALEPFDVSTPQGRFTRTIILASYTLEGEMISQRTKMRMKDIASKKYWMGGNPPFGFDSYQIIDDEGKKRRKLKINEEQAKIVREIFELRLKNIGYSEIAKRLNERGIKNARGNLWRGSTILDMINNPLYAGIYIYGKGNKRSRKRSSELKDAVIIENFVEPIISREVFEEVNRKNGKLTNALTRHKYLLKGLIYTENGDRMVGAGGKTPSYVSSAWHSGKTRGYIGIAKSKIEREVFLHVKHRLLEFDFDDDEFWEEFAETLNYVKKLKMNIENEKVLALRKRLEEIEEQLINITNAIKAGIINDEIKKENELLTKEKNDIINQIKMADMHFDTETPERLKKKWREKIQALENYDEDKLIEIYNQLIERIIVYKDKFIEINFKQIE